MNGAIRRAEQERELACFRGLIVLRTLFELGELPSHCHDQVREILDEFAQRDKELDEALASVYREAA